MSEAFHFACKMKCEVEGPPTFLTIAGDSTASNETSEA